MTRSQEPAVELCVRSLGASIDLQRIERVIDRLESLERTGSIAEFSVSIHGDGIVPASTVTNTDAGRRIYHRVLLLRQWTALNDAERQHLFADRTHRSSDGAIEESIVFPPMMLLEFESTRLEFATPFETADRRYTIEEHLDALDEDATAMLPARAASTPVEDPHRTGSQNTGSESRGSRQVRPGDDRW